MFMAELYQVPKSERAKRARELLELFDLYDRYKQRVMKFSKGLKRRLTIALALVHSPEILFLDEPTAGLDVQSSRMIRTLIKRLNKEENTTIFLTTHYIEEADELCQRVAIINKGRIVALDNPEKLKIAARGESVIEVTFDKIPNRIEDELMHMDYIGNVTRHGDKLRLFIEDPSEDILSIANFAQMKGLKIISINTLKPTLEEAFIELTGLSPIMIERFLIWDQRIDSDKNFLSGVGSLRIKTLVCHIYSGPMML